MQKSPIKEPYNTQKRTTDTCEPHCVFAQFPDAVSYNTLLSACAHASDGYRALDILEEMREFAIPIDVGAYNSALKACCVAGLVDRALELFARMMNSKVRVPKEPCKRAL